MNGPAPIATLQRLSIAGDQQWVLVRGRDRSRPVLLLVQAGPGLPIIHMADLLQADLGLEEEFVVAYWDQRGTGKSFHRGIPAESMTVAQIVADTAAMAVSLSRELDSGPVYALGFSFGGSLAAMAANRHPELFRAVVGVGMDVDIAESERASYAFAVDQAAQAGNRRAQRQLAAIGPPPYRSSRSFRIRARWVTDFGGGNRKETFGSLIRKTLGQMISSPDYSLLDVTRAVRGSGWVQRLVVPQLANFDLLAMAPRIEVPLFVFQGRHDQVSPGDLARRYFEAVDAVGGKQLVWFEESAHAPHLEEPGAFREALLRARDKVEGRALPAR